MKMFEITTRSSPASLIVAFAWNFSRSGRFLAVIFAAPSTVSVKLAGLRSVVISNIFCSKNFK